MKRRDSFRLGGSSEEDASLRMTSLLCLLAGLIGISQISLYEKKAVNIKENANDVLTAKGEYICPDRL
jgi:hypothetical protein